MPQTLFDKIWQSHLVARRTDGRDLIYIDRHVMHDLHTPHALAQLEKKQRAVRRPDLTFATQDHTIASKPGRASNTKPWPICLPTCSNTGRAIESMALPAGNGVISRIGWRVGQVWAAAGAATRRAAMEARAGRAGRRRSI